MINRLPAERVRRRGAGVRGGGAGAARQAVDLLPEALAEGRCGEHGGARWCL